MAKIRITQIRSAIRRTERQRACLMGLGVRGIGRSVEVNDTPAHRGMIKKVNFMLRVEEIGNG